MTQLFKVLIDSVSFTDSVIDCNLSFGIGRVFNTGVLTVAGIEADVLLYKDIEITHGDNVFNGFIFSYDKASNDSHTLNIRSLGGKLTEPFFVDADGVALATTAIDLCAEYSTASGVTITYTTEDLDFIGSWVENGSPDSELIKLANITGADIYDNNTGVVIEPAKAVSGDAIIINPDEIVDFASIGDSIMNNGLGLVTIQTSNESNNDIISENKFSVDIDECTGDAKVYPVPYGDLTSFKGISLVRSNQYDVLTVKKLMNSETTLEVDGAITDVLSAYLNGIAITNYKFQADTNLIYFEIPQSGELSIEYSTKYHMMSITKTSTPSGLFGSFEIIKDTSYLTWSGFFTCDVEDNKNADFGYTVESNDYVVGAVIYTFGVPPSITLYSGADRISLTGRVVTEIGTYNYFEKPTLQHVDDGSYIMYTKQPIFAVSEVTSAGQVISHSTAYDSDGILHITLTQYYPDVEVLYSSNGMKISVMYAQDPDNLQQTLVLSVDTDSDGLNDAVYDIDLTSTIDDSWYDPDKFPCGYPADFPFNIAELLGMKLDDVVGINIPSMGIVDSKGFVFVTITQDGIYEYDTSIVMDRTSITLRANTNGSLT